MCHGCVGPGSGHGGKPGPPARGRAMAAARRAFARATLSRVGSRKTRRPPGRRRAIGVNIGAGGVVLAHGPDGESVSTRIMSLILDPPRPRARLAGAPSSLAAPPPSRSPRLRRREAPFSSPAGGTSGLFDRAAPGVGPGQRGRARRASPTAAAAGPAPRPAAQLPKRSARAATLTWPRR